MKIKKITEEAIIFDNDNKLTYIHEQECCENVFADFEHLQVMTNIGQNFINSDDLDFDENLLKSIIKVPDMGFFIVDKNGIKVFVSCYDVQNGYYSSDLELCYTQAVVKYDVSETIDISDCTKYEEI